MTHMDFEGDSGLYSMSEQYGTNHHRHTVEDHDYDDLNNHKATMTNDAINDGTLPSQYRGLEPHRDSRNSASQ